MSDWYQPQPTHREFDDQLKVDDVKLHRDERPMDPTDGAFSAAWYYVKERPFETILLGFLQVLLGGGGANCFNPSGLGDLFNESGGGGETYDYANNIYGLVAAGIGGGEAAIIALVLVMVFGVAIVMLVLSTLVNGGAQIFWLRMVRGQEATLNHCGRVMPALLPLLVTSILAGLAYWGGLMLLIIPGIIIHLGLMFTSIVVIDKQLAFVDALKASWRLTSGYKWSLLLMAILMGLLNFGGILLCCVGIFATTAVCTGVMVIIYDRIAEPGNAYLDLETELSAFD